MCHLCTWIVKKTHKKAHKIPVNYICTYLPKTGVNFCYLCLFWERERDNCLKWMLQLIYVVICGLHFLIFSHCVQANCSITFIFGKLLSLIFNFIVFHLITSYFYSYTHITVFSRTQLCSYDSEFTVHIIFLQKAVTVKFQYQPHSVLRPVFYFPLSPSPKQPCSM